MTQPVNELWKNAMTVKQDNLEHYKSMLKHYQLCLRKRHKLSARMQDMLEYIRKEGKVHSSYFSSYKDGRTLNALHDLSLVIMDDLTMEYRLSTFSDENIKDYIKLYKKLIKEMTT